MSTICKIKIIDNETLRNELDLLFEKATKIQAAQWALELATHILELLAPEYLQNEIILEGFKINQEWQNNNARIHDVRQAGFAIHRLAKECGEKSIQSALRVVGQAVATGHMKEHGMVASDYAIKYINIAYPKNISFIAKERFWQINKLKGICML